ncbi:MAG: protein translocase subunit SecF, partial [bacterium]|nr:protein translocase subunit SecF [bacterium]
MKLNIVKQRKTWFALSSTLVIASIIAIATLGLNFGIDFTGGSLLEIETTETHDIEDVRTRMTEAGYENLSIQSSDDNGLIIRTSDLTEEEHQVLLTSLGEQLGEVEEHRFDSIGPVIGNELRRTASVGVLLTLILIGLYIAWA